MRLIAYARVSTDDQNTIEEQVTKMRAFCDLHDHELVGIHKDHGLSAKDMNRAGLQAALRDLKNADGIVIVKLDRLSRSVHDWCALTKMLDKQKKALLSVLDSLDTTTAGGIMVSQMFAVVAEWERRVISERTKATLAHLRSQGRRISRHAPFGFEADPDRPHHWKTCSHEQEILIKIRELHGCGLTYSDIARQLNEFGYTTRNGTDWDRAGVWRIVNAAKRD
jgi:DNA invertase Pin-like site-specific DNA recombinase